MDNTFFAQRRRDPGRSDSMEFIPIIGIDTDVAIEAKPDFEWQIGEAISLTRMLTKVYPLIWWCAAVEKVL